MNIEEINKILNQIIDNSKFNNLPQEQKETLKKKIIQKYINDFNLIALEMLDRSLQEEFTKILATANQVEIENFIAKNISDIETLTKKASEKFSADIYLMLQN
jgi:hypothetical protein